MSCNKSSNESWTSFCLRHENDCLDCFVVYGDPGLGLATPDTIIRPPFGIGNSPDRLSNRFHIRSPSPSDRQRLISDMILRLEEKSISNADALDTAIRMREGDWNMDTAELIHAAITSRMKVVCAEDAEFLRRNLSEHALLLDTTGRNYEAEMNRNIIAGLDVFAGKGDGCEQPQQDSDI